MRDQPLRELAHAITSNKRTRVSRRGLTLVEVLIVLTIMASIMGIVGVVAINALRPASIKETEIQLGKLNQQLQQYQIMHASKLPEDLNALVTESYTTHIPKDGWGQDFIYRKITDKEFALYSLGPDEQEGTADDIYTPIK